MYRGLTRVYLETCIKNLSKCGRKHAWQRNRIHHTVLTTFTIYPIGLMYRRLNQDITCSIIHERLLDAHICDIYTKIARTVQFPTHNMDMGCSLNRLSPTPGRLSRKQHFHRNNILRFSCQKMASCHSKTTHYQSAIV